MAQLFSSPLVCISTCPAWPLGPEDNLPGAMGGNTLLSPPECKVGLVLPVPHPHCLGCKCSDQPLSHPSLRPGRAASHVITKPTQDAAACHTLEPRSSSSEPLGMSVASPVRNLRHRIVWQLGDIPPSQQGLEGWRHPGLGLLRQEQWSLLGPPTGQRQRHCVANFVGC